MPSSIYTNGHYHQASFADWRPSGWDLFLNNWFQVGFMVMRAAGYDCLMLHDEVHYRKRTRV